MIKEASEKYFIIHLGNRPFSLTNMFINLDSMTLNGFLGTVDPSHLDHIQETNKNYVYKNKAVLDEIHLYAPGFILREHQSLNLSIPLTMINEVETITPDRVRTNRSRTVGIVIGVMVGIVVVAAIIASLSSFSLGSTPGKTNSCPIVL